MNPALPLTLQVLRSAVGNGPVTPFATLNEASAAFRAFIESNGFGSRDAGECVIRQGNTVVAHVSYNGKVWPGRKWTPDTKPIFEP